MPIFLCGATAQIGPMSPCFLFSKSQADTPGRTLPNEWSARRRDHFTYRFRQNYHNIILRGWWCNECAPSMEYKLMLQCATKLLSRQSTSASITVRSVWTCLWPLNSRNKFNQMQSIGSLIHDNLNVINVITNGLQFINP